MAITNYATSLYVFDLKYRSNWLLLPVGAHVRNQTVAAKEMYGVQASLIADLGDGTVCLL